MRREESPGRDRGDLPSPPLLWKRGGSTAEIKASTRLARGRIRNKHSHHIHYGSNLSVGQGAALTLLILILNTRSQGKQPTPTLLLDQRI